MRVYVPPPPVSECVSSSPVDGSSVPDMSLVCLKLDEKKNRINFLPEKVAR